MSRAPVNSQAARANDVSRLSTTVTVLVAGMHRTGTSAVAGALLATGFHAGSMGDFQLATAENPRGYGELRQVMHFNEQLLSLLGWTWDSPAPQPMADYSVLDRFVDDGRRLVRDLLGSGDGARLIKDPRVSLLLPTWRKILLDRAVVVVTLRQPDEVAWSLYVRNGLHLALGHALWKAYHRHLAKGLEGLPVIFVDYSKLVDDPAGSIGLLFNELERLTGAGPLDREVATATVDPSLRRATVPATAWSPGDKSAEVLFAAWCPDAVTSFDSFAGDGLPDPEAWEEALLDVHRLGRRRQQDLDGLLAATRTVKQDLVDRTVNERDALKAERDALQVEVDDAGAETGELKRELDASRAEAAQLRQQLRAAAEDRDKVRTRLSAEAAELRRGLEVYQNSTSWRVTAPLRKVGAMARALLGRPRP